jgi:hypothetical protein
MTTKSNRTLSTTVYPPESGITGTRSAAAQTYNGPVVQVTVYQREGSEQIRCCLSPTLIRFDPDGAWTSNTSWPSKNQWVRCTPVPTARLNRKALQAAMDLVLEQHLPALLPELLALAESYREGGVP